MNQTPTLKDVAEALGMHKSTVSLALSGKGNISALTRARVIAKARELGYEPNLLAQRLASGHRNEQVCVFTGALDVGLATAKVLAIQQRLNARGLDVPIYTCGDFPGEHGSPQGVQMRQLRRQRPRAIVCATSRVEPAVFRELEGYQQEGGAVVSYDAPAPLPCDQVLFDREESAYQAARHLLERGHRRLGIGLSRPPGMGAGHPYGEPLEARLRGFQRALAEFGQPVREEWVFVNGTYEPGGAEMARRFLRLSERPTAVCIVNDYVALAFMVEIMRAGLRVPEDVSIVSHDNQPVCEYTPVPLTSVAHPVDEIVRCVVEMLLERLYGVIDPSTPPRAVRLTGELVERRSVAALTAG